MDISTDELRRLFSYDPETGVLRHNTRAAMHVHAGSIAGSIHKGHGGVRYIRIVVGGKRYMAHRAIYQILGINVPDGMLIDHIDGDGTNNRMSNLRVVSHVGNCQNTHRTRSRNKERKIGTSVTIRKDGTHAWKACITIPNPNGAGPGKRVVLGTYETEEDAVRAYRLAKEQFHIPTGPIWT